MMVWRIDILNEPGARCRFLGLMSTLGLLLFTLATGCDEKPVPEPSIGYLRLGFLPDLSEEALAGRYAPLLAYLEAKTGIPCCFVMCESYESLLADFRAGDVDLALFGGVTYVAAEHYSDAVPLVMRLKDMKFTSYYIVRADDPGVSMTEFQGRTFSFGARLSTSGHFMPRHFLQEQGIKPEEHFGEVQYSGSHDATIFAVRDGHADIGAVNASIFDEMIRTQKISYDEIRILQQTPAYSNYVWAAQPDLPEALGHTIRESFLELSTADEEDSVILNGLDAMGYLPASSLDFQDLGQIMLATGMLDER